MTNGLKFTMKNATKFGGATPKAAWIILTEHTTDESTKDNVNVSFGICDASSEACIWWGSRHNVTEGDGARILMNTECGAIYQADQGTPNRDGWLQLDADGFIADGITLIANNTFDGDYFITVVLFGGADLSAKVGTFDPHDDEDSATTVTPGFETNALITLQTGTTGSTATNSNNDYRGNIGIFSWNGTTRRQSCISFSQDEGHADGNPYLSVSGGLTDGSARISRYIDGTSALYSLEVTSVTSTTFLVTTRDAASSGTSHPVYYLALKLPSDVKAWVGVVDTPTTIKSESYTPTGLDFKGQFLFQLPTISDSVDDLKAGVAEAGSIGIGVNTVGSEHCVSWQIEDDEGTTDTQTITENTSIELPDDAGLDFITASFTGFDAQGWTQDFTDTDGTARKIPSLVIGEVPAGAATNRLNLIHPPQYASEL